jgi:hypothetical protein
VPPSTARESRVTPSARGCEECLNVGRGHLSALGSCGVLRRVARQTCDQLLHATGHPIIEGYDPPEGWGWCYDDETLVDLPDQTPQLGPIVRCVR